MIRIVQIGKENSNPMGVRLYEVGINNHPAIATFKHTRSDGLAECLRKAAAAVDKARMKQVADIMDLMP